LLGGRFATAHDRLQGGIGGDLITERDVAAAHAPRCLRIGRQRLGRKPRPQHKAVRAGGAGRNPQAERIAGSPALIAGRAQNKRSRHQAKARAGGGSQEAAARRPVRDLCHVAVPACKSTSGADLTFATHLAASPQGECQIQKLH
jgi:hypothetical protein